MKRIILGVAAVLCLSVGQAAADGLPSRGYIKGPVQAAVPDWNGFSIGVGIGGAAMVTDVKESDYFSESHLDGVGAEGVFGTVSIGYDRLIHPNWVAGVFADYDFGSNVSTDISQSSWLFGSSHGSIDQNYTWSVGARLGYLVTPSTLVYGTGGYTQTELDISGLGSHTFDGYFVGTGIETMLRPNWSLKLEYRFSQFEDVKFNEDCYRLSVEPSEQTARLVLSYKFGARD